MKKEYSFVDHQYDVWHIAKISQKFYHKRLKPRIVVNSTHGSTPLLTTYSGLHKPVTMIHSFLLKNGSLLYIIFPMYINGTVILKHCALNVCIKHDLLRKSKLRNGCGSVVQLIMLYVRYKIHCCSALKITSFHHTSSLEVFLSLLLKYCPKRQYFT